MTLAAFLISFFLHHAFFDETVAGYMENGTVWRLAEMDGAPVDPDVTVEFARGGGVSGNAPCNAFSATQTAPYPWFELSQILSTRRACPDLKIEARFFEQLGAMSLSELSGSVLLLSNDAGDVLVFEQIKDAP